MRNHKAKCQKFGNHTVEKITTFYEKESTTKPIAVSSTLTLWQYLKVILS